MGRKNKKKPKPRGYWTKDRVIAEAIKYGSSKKWRNGSPGSYRMASKNGWYIEISEKYLTRLTKFITKEDVFAESLKYNRRVDFQNKSPSYYAKALNNGWLEQCCKHMMSNKDSLLQSRPYKWTEESLMKEMKNHVKYRDFIAIKGVRDSLERLGILQKVKSQMIHGHQVKWTYDTIKEEAKKYFTITDFEKHAGGACRRMYQLGLKDELCSHMKTFEEQMTKWTSEKIINAILECRTRETLNSTYPGAYFRYKQNPDLYKHLFIKDALKIEEELLHPKIKKIFQKYKLQFYYEKIFKRKKNSIRPDFLYEKDGKIFIIEAKTSGCYNSISKKELEQQVLDQIDYVSEYYKDRQIVHIVVSEAGLIKSKKTDYNMSLKELEYFLKNGTYKSMPIKVDKHTHSKLSAKIRKEYFKKCR